MLEEPKTERIELATLLDRVTELKQSGYRLVQIGCTVAEGIELNYSFDKDYDLLNLRLNLAAPDIEIPSISRIYPNAFLYENEMHDLFGINLKDMAVDYKGNFYRLAVKTPFAPQNNQKEKEQLK
jgi:ech hydrogenase subunit D